jgi:hypothetical protein
MTEEDALRFIAVNPNYRIERALLVKMPSGHWAIAVAELQSDGKLRHVQLPLDEEASGGVGLALRLLVARRPEELQRAAEVMEQVQEQLGEADLKLLPPAGRA